MLARAFFLIVQGIARQVETDNGAARVITNLGAYQDSKHLHFHVASGARISNVTRVIITPVKGDGRSLPVIPARAGRILAITAYVRS